MTCLAFILVCDDNKPCFPLFLHLCLCLVCACSITWFMPSCVISICWLHPCFFVCLEYACLLAYLVYVTKPCFKIWIRVGSHLSIYTKSRDPLLGALLIDNCVILNSIQWIYGHHPNLHMWRLSIYACLFVCLFVSMLSPLCLSISMFPFIFLLAYLHVYLSLFFCLVFLFVCLHVVDGACTLLPKGEQNGID